MMKPRRTSKRLVSFIITAAVLCWAAQALSSCASSQVSSGAYGKPALKGRNPSIFLEPIQVSSFDYPGGSGIRCIFDKKLRFALAGAVGAGLSSSREKADLLIVPDLVLKLYQVNYRDRCYYRLNMTVLVNSGSAVQSGAHHVKREQIVYRGYCEYSGRSSIFDVNLQEKLMNSLIKDMTGRLVP